VAAFRGTFQAGAVYGDLSNVVPDMQDEPEPPSDGSGSPEGPLDNEPEGFKSILDETWTSTTPEGWSVRGDESNASIVPVLGSNDVLQFRYPEGMEGGRAPVTLTYDWSSNAGITTDDVLIGMRWSANSDWQGHDSYIDKIAFIWLDDADGSHFVIVKYGNKIRIAPQQPGGFDYLKPTSDMTLQLGAWNDLEFRFKKTGPGTWHVTWWVNGDLAGDYEDVPMPSDDGSIRNLQLSPTWGGTGDTKTQTDYFWWDRVRVSAGDI